MKKLNPKIIEKIHKKSGLAVKTIGPAISKMKTKHLNLTTNGVAYLYGLEHGVNVRTLLDAEDKSLLPAIDIKPAEKIKVKKPTPKKKEVVVLELQTTDPFIKGHIDEINRAYNARCYTSVVILSRKIIENLIIDILTKKFPPSVTANRDLYYDTARGRHKDFSVILDNLYKKRVSFGVDKSIVEKLYSMVKKLKGDANDKTHSWFHLVSRQKEIDDLELQKVIELIKRLL